ncbi:MAG: histidine phosphatase family protein [Ignavibacteria bacterium]|nr:histidine phosphatase family protein [Ignavibacteria bacterium]
MKIGLLRHFKVKLKYPKKPLLSFDEVTAWYDKYNAAEVEIKKVDLSGGNWQKCYASPLHRAQVTTKASYNGDVNVVEVLKELDVLPVLKGTRRKPFLIWGLWLKIHSTRKNHITEKFESGLSAFLEDILKNDKCDVLLICHGFVMTYLQQELRKKGFKGGGFLIPAYGKVYVYENKLIEPPAC